MVVLVVGWIFRSKGVSIRMDMRFAVCIHRGMAFDTPISNCNKIVWFEEKSSSTCRAFHLFIRLL
jgi:hypothetical protein